MSPIAGKTVSEVQARPGLTYLPAFDSHPPGPAETTAPCRKIDVSRKDSQHVPPLLLQRRPKPRSSS